MLRSENARVSGWVYVDLRGRDLRSAVTEMQQRFGQGVKLPGGYSIAWSGQFEVLERASERLKVVVPFTLAIIFVLLYLTFRRVEEALLILLAVPLAPTGSFWLIWALGHAIVVHERNVRSLNGGVSCSHRKTNFCLGQSRCVIDTITDHSNHVPAALKLFNGFKLLLRKQLAWYFRNSDLPCYFFGCVVVITRQDLVPAEGGPFRCQSVLQISDAPTEAPTGQMLCPAGKKAGTKPSTIASLGTSKFENGPRRFINRCHTADGGSSDLSGLDRSAACLVVAGTYRSHRAAQRCGDESAETAQPLSKLEEQVVSRAGGIDASLLAPVETIVYKFTGPPNPGKDQTFPYTHEAHAACCGRAARARQVLVQHVQAWRGQIVYCGTLQAPWTTPDGLDLLIFWAGCTKE